MLRHLILSFVLLINVSFFPNARFNSSGLALAQNAAPTPSGFDSTYKLTLRNPVQDKNFYLLSLFQQNPEVGKLLRQNPVLKKLSRERRQALTMAANCDDVGCFDRLFRLSGPTIETVTTELKVFGRHPEFKKLVMKDLRPSGAFIKYSQRSDAEMLVAAWRDAANGMYRLLRVDGVGTHPV